MLFQAMMNAEPMMGDVDVPLRKKNGAPQAAPHPISKAQRASLVVDPSGLCENDEPIDQCPYRIYSQSDNPGNEDCEDRNL